MMDAVQQANENNQEGLGKNFVCRQSSTRWTPTTEQIRILKDLYYNNGVRSPTAEQIQRISAKLRQYGKIEGKNVFYWFQNHKARERQKKRFTTTNDHIHIPMPMHTNNNNVIISNNCNNNRPNAAGIDHVSPIYNNFSNKMNPGNFASSSSTSTARGLLSTVGNYGYGSVSVAMEKSFRECSITPNVNACGSMGQKFAWLGVDHPYPNFVDKRKYMNHQTLEINGQDEEDPDQIETLPLFPMHGDDDDIKHDYNINGWQSSDDPRASLELTLNSSYSATSASTSFNIFK